jgi:glycosyltransferase involved in cell wall biosynthesis
MKSNLYNPLIVVPVYNAENAILNVCIDLCKSLDRNQRVIFLDNNSSDNTIAVFKKFLKVNPASNLEIIKNKINLGLGGSQKKAFSMASSQGYSHLVIFHGDGQPYAKDLARLISLLKETTNDAILGSRFMKESSRIQYSRIRTFGNQLFNLIFSIRFKTPIYDIGSGLNGYRINGMERDLSHLPDDLSFNSFLLAQQIKTRENVAWTPISWKNSEAGSNLKIVRIGLKCLKALF